MSTEPSPLANAAADEFASGYDILLVNGTIDHKLFSSIVTCVSRNKANDKIVLVLVTYGGSANDAFRIGRYLRLIYPHVVVFVPSLCKSAGTLVAIAADRLLFGTFGEIGPLDVQLYQRDEIFGRRSGLTTRSALADLQTHSFELFQKFATEIVRRSLGAVSFRLAADIASKVTSGTMIGIYSQINPDAMGQDFRDLNVATEYGKRLDARSGNLKAGALRKLVHDYPSHDFVIDFEEAKTLFNRIELPSPTLYNLITSKWASLGTPSLTTLFVEMADVGQQRVVRDEQVEAKPRAQDGSSDGRLPTDQRRDNGGKEPAP